MDIVTLQNGRFIEISEVYNIYIDGESNSDYSIENIRKELIDDMNQQIKEGNLMKALKRKYSILNLDEHSEQARAPHTNGPRDVPRCGALSLIKRL